jgi:hypothetical protein
MSEAWETVYPGGDTRCANGEDFRFHVRHAATDKLMLFWNGGGACWTGRMCDPANSTNDISRGMIYRSRPTAEYGNHPRTYDGAFALANEENPFKDWTIIFIPYITGDVHLGNRDRTYQKDDGSEFVICHRGRANSKAVLEYAARTFASPTRVFVSGASAGGIASSFYAGEVAEMYPDAEIVQFSGGSSGYRAPFPQTDQWKVWGVFDDLPEWFDAKRFRLENTRIIDFFFATAAAFPRIKFHTYDTAYDQTQTVFHTLIGFPSLLYHTLQANRAELDEILPYIRSYTAPGSFHSLLRFDELYTRKVAGVRVVDWVRDIADGKEVENVNCGNSAESR